MKISLFDKILENLRNKIEVRLVTNSKDYIKLVSTPSLFLKIFNENLVAVHKIKAVLTSDFNM